MREKAKDNPSVLSKLGSVTPEQIEGDIQTKINEMKTIVILKRIEGRNVFEHQSQETPIHS